MTRPAPTVRIDARSVPSSVRIRPRAPSRSVPVDTVADSTAVPSAPAHDASAACSTSSTAVNPSTGSISANPAVRACQSAPPTMTSCPPFATQRSMLRRCASLRPELSSAHTMADSPSSGSERSGRSASVSESGAGTPIPSPVLSCGRRVPAPSPTIANWLEACSRTRVSTIALTVPFGSWNWMVTCRWNASGWR